MPVETFANTPSTTVPSGKGAPSGGTVETWTVTSSGSFPAAATGATQFHVADAAASSEAILVTNVSGTTWTVTRGAEGTTPVTHTAGFTIYQVTTAGALKQLRNTDWINVVTQFGATGNGGTDDTTAIQNAVTAAKNTGSAVYFPAGNYIVSSPLLVGGGSPGAIQVTGDGWNSQITLKNSSNCYLFDFGSSGSPQYTPGLIMRDLYLSCNGTNQTGSSGAVYARGAVWCLFDHLWIDSPLEAAIRFFQDGTGAYGHHNTVRACLVTGGSISGQYGVWLDHCDETVITENTFQNVGVTSDTYPGAVYDRAGLQAIIGNNFVGGTGVNVGGAGNRTRIIGNIFDGSGSGSGQVYAGNSGVVVADNYLYNILAGKDGVFVDNTDSVVVRDNQCTTLTNAAVQSGVHLSATCTNCIVEGNVMTTQGTGSYTAANGIKIDNATSGNTGTVVRDNRPYNPLGALGSQPSVPGSTTPYSNANNADCTVYITAGSSTCAVAIGGSAMFTIASSGTGTARVQAGQSITLTYSNAPTWKWAGD